MKKILMLMLLIPSLAIVANAQSYNPVPPSTDPINPVVTPTIVDPNNGSYDNNAGSGSNGSTTIMKTDLGSFDPNDNTGNTGTGTTNFTNTDNPTNTDNIRTNSSITNTDNGTTLPGSTVPGTPGTIVTQ
jgi:hypothetical protein